VPSALFQNLLEQNALVSHVLINYPEPLWIGRQDKRVAYLPSGLSVPSIERSIASSMPSKGNAQVDAVSGMASGSAYGAVPPNP